MVAKSQRDIQGMRKVNEATACLLNELAQRAEPGITTGDLNAHARPLHQADGRGARATSGW